MDFSGSNSSFQYLFSIKVSMALKNQTMVCVSLIPFMIYSQNSIGKPILFCLLFFVIILEIMFLLQEKQFSRLAHKILESRTLHENLKQISIILSSEAFIRKMGNAISSKMVLRQNKQISDQTKLITSILSQNILEIHQSMPFKVHYFPEQKKYKVLNEQIQELDNLVPKIVNELEYNWKYFCQSSLKKFEILKLMRQRLRLQEKIFEDISDIYTALDVKGDENEMIWDERILEIKNAFEDHSNLSKDELWHILKRLQDLQAKLQGKVSQQQQNIQKTEIYEYSNEKKLLENDEQEKGTEFQQIKKEKIIQGQNNRQVFKQSLDFLLKKGWHERLEKLEEEESKDHLQEQIEYDGEERSYQIKEIVQN